MAPPDTAAPTATTLEGLKIPLAPDSLGAQVLLSASEFVSRLGTRAIDALDTVQSLPLLYGWVMVMATNYTARSLLEDVVWRVAVVLACAAAVEYGLRRAMRRPIRSLESLAPAVRLEGLHRAAGGPKRTTMPLPVPRRGRSRRRCRAGAGPSAWNLLKRVPLVLARLLLELVPVLGIVLAGHLFAGSGLGGQTVSRLIILAVVDSYAVCVGVAVRGAHAAVASRFPPAAVPAARHHGGLSDVVEPAADPDRCVRICGRRGRAVARLVRHRA